ncbi:MAG: DUF4037 domain-containing protein [Lachnospiraceae bacterium]
MKGLELCRAYFEAYGRQLVHETAPDYENRVAFGLVGHGSECFGFDDEISTDHDFGPGFCMWLTKEDFTQVGARLQEAYEQLPNSFMGYSARNVTRQGGGRVGAMEIDSFYAQFVGEMPKTKLDWLDLSEEYLATATNGAVFYDPLGEFTKKREQLLSYFPEDVRRKKLAARAAKMAQSGQYNYSRCMNRGETVAATLALAEFVEQTIAAVYLLNNKYMPYYKWKFHGMESLPKCQDVAAMIQLLCELPLQKEVWTAEMRAQWTVMLNTNDKKVLLIEWICGKIIEEMKMQGLTESDSDYMEAHAYEIMERISDDTIRQMHLMEGVRL